MRALYHLAPFAIMAGSILAQIPPRAPELVKRVLDQYARVTTASFTETITSNSVTLKYTVAGQLPDKMRMEMDDETARLSDFGLDTGGVIIIANGTNQFIRFLGRNTHRASQLETAEASRLGEMLPPFGLNFDIEKSRYLPDEAIDGALCYVVELFELKPRNGSESYRWWIEKSTEKVVRAHRSGGLSESTVTFEHLRLNEPLSPEMFMFVPPTGSRQVE